MSISRQDRLAGALYGSLVADSLALGAHWIYDQEELRRTYGRVEELLAPHPDSYHPKKQRGEQTHYGDQALTLLASLQKRGGFEAAAWEVDWQTMWAGYPDYFDKATKETLANLQAGKPEPASSSAELGGAARIAPLLVATAEAKLEDAVTAARAQTALTHGSEIAGDAAEWLTGVVRAALEGLPLAQALTAANAGRYDELAPRSLTAQVRAVAGIESTSAAAKELGLACPAPQALPTLLLLLERHGDDLETALIENVMAGGDNAARALALGMILGAVHGRAALPERWLQGLKAAPQVEAFLR